MPGILLEGSDTDPFKMRMSEASTANDTSKDGLVYTIKREMGLMLSSRGLQNDC